jgi:two-component system OmpR family sensor kinase
MIRRRLTATVVGVVAVIGVAVAVAFLRTWEARLVAGVDRELERVPAALTPVAATRLERQADREARLYDIRRVAYVRVGADGEVVAGEPSGPTADPDPLPDVTGLPTPTGPRTVDSIGLGGPRYRVVTSVLPDGSTLAIALSLEDVEDTVAKARRGLAVAGLVALVAIAVASWTVIRRGLRPIDRMVDTAEAIADGHLDERVPVPDPGSEVGRLGGALNQMLDRIAEALAARTASERRMRRFVADASHELRTPLTAVRGYAELARQGGDAAATAVAVERIEQAAVRMGSLVDDLVLLARLDQGRPLEAELVDLAELVAESIADARAVEPGRTVRADGLGTADAHVTGDKQRLRQVVDNLLANVREHTDATTTVAVTLESGPDDAVLTVADDGPGMAEADTAVAFDRFWQGAATEAHPRRGTGLGLAIVADLVAAHGGDVRLDSRPGEGTRVSIRLPLAADTRSASRAPHR